MISDFNEQFDNYRQQQQTYKDGCQRHQNVCFQNQGTSDIKNCLSKSWKNN